VIQAIAGVGLTSARLIADGPYFCVASKFSMIVMSVEPGLLDAMEADIRRITTQCAIYGGDANASINLTQSELNRSMFNIVQIKADEKATAYDAKAVLNEVFSYSPTCDLCKGLGNIRTQCQRTGTAALICSGPQPAAAHTDRVRCPKCQGMGVTIASFSAGGAEYVLNLDSLQKLLLPIRMISRIEPDAMGEVIMHACSRAEYHQAAATHPGQEPVDVPWEYILRFLDARMRWMCAIVPYNALTPTIRQQMISSKDALWRYALSTIPHLEFTVDERDADRLFNIATQFEGPQEVANDEDA
jgi:hypothetical protein